MWTYAETAGDRIKVRMLFLDGGKVVEEKVQFLPKGSRVTLNGQALDLTRCL